jgi:hypothetical protein
VAQAGQYDPSVVARIRERLTNLSQGDGDGSLWLLSYDNSVLLAAPEGVQARHLAELIKDPSIRSFPSSELNGHSSNNIPTYESLTLEDAIAVAKRVLEKGGHLSKETALAQKDLRPRMMVQDRRAAKKPGDAASESMITAIVTNGVKDGWLEAFKRIPGKTGTEAVFMRHSSDRSAQASLLQTSHLASAIEATHGVSVNLQTRNEQANGPRKFQNRATMFEQELQTRRIGALPETRELFFNVIDELMTERSGTEILLPDLFTEANKRAQLKAQEASFAAEKNWGISAKCIQRLMLSAGAFIGEKGTPLADKIGANSTPIASLAPDFRRLCEAHIVIHIIKTLGGINYDDDPYYLGLVLYRRGREHAVPPEELKTKVDKLLTHLWDQRQIVMDEDRMIRVPNKS